MAVMGGWEIFARNGGKPEIGGWFCNWDGWDIFKGCFCYIFASLFLSLNESTCQTRKNIFYFTSKALFVLKEMKF